MENKVQKAISELASLGDYWSLMADTEPEVFLLCVKDEIVRLRKQNELSIDILNKIISLKKEYETLCANCPQCIDCGPGTSAMFSMAKIAERLLETLS